MTQQAVQTASKAFPHAFSVDEARVRAETAFEFYRDQDLEKKTGVNPTFAWRPTNANVADITLTFNGKMLRGTLTIEPRRVVLELAFPHEFRLMAPMALDMVSSEVQKWLI